MGVRSLNNTLSSFGYKFGRTGLEAASERPPTVRSSGGTVLNPGNGYIYNVFTSPGTFTTLANWSPRSVEYLVVAGGGSGGNAYGGGGGAGGLRTGSFTISGPQPVTIGDGGSAIVQTYSQGNEGANSVFGPITSQGGGGGGGGYPTSTSGNGGSGGGGGFFARSDGASGNKEAGSTNPCLLYTSPSPRDLSTSRMPSSA